jgi:hypothetical protein
MRNGTLKGARINLVAWTQIPRTGRNPLAPRMRSVAYAIALLMLVHMELISTGAQAVSETGTDRDGELRAYRGRPLPEPPVIRRPTTPIHDPDQPEDPNEPKQYYVDVTNFGAKPFPGKGEVVDNGPQIQAAINSICAHQPAAGNSAVLFFPPGIWPVQQPQTPSTSSALTMPCSFEIEGSGDDGGGAQFAQLAHGSWLLSIPGPSPNDAALIATNNKSLVMKNLVVEGYNQAVAIYASAPTIFENVCLSVNKTDMPDNTPLRITDSFWVWFTHGCLQTNSPDVPVTLFTADDLGGPQQQVGNIFFADLITAGGGFKYIQRAPLNSGPPGGFVFRRITMEDAPDVFDISQTCTSCSWAFDILEFDTVQVSDSSCGDCSIVNMNMPDAGLTGVIIRNSIAGNGGLGSAIKVVAGRLGSHQIDSCVTYCSQIVVDGDGNIVWNYTGKVTLSGGTKTLTFYPVAFTERPPVCIPNDETTINGARITTTLTTMTITGGPSDVVDYACYPDRIKIYSEW